MTSQNIPKARRSRGNDAALSLHISGQSLIRCCLLVLVGLAALHVLLDHTAALRVRVSVSLETKPGLASDEPSPSGDAVPLINDEKMQSASEGSISLREDAAAPQFQIVRASEVIDRVPRQLSNQADFSQEDSCPQTLSQSSSAASKMQTTLATQLSFNRLWLLEETCQRWKEPIVATIYLDSSAVSNYQHIQTSLVQALTERGCPHVKLIFFLQDNESAGKDTPKDTAQQFYPINMLRNLSLEAVQTSHVLVVDIDFVPSATLANDIREAWEVRRGAAEVAALTVDASSSSNGIAPFSPLLEAMVVPALELSPENKTREAAFIAEPWKYSHWIPSNFDQLEECISRGDCRSFLENKDKAHGTTRTSEWLAKQWYDHWRCQTKSEDTPAEAVRVKDIRKVPCIMSPAYEPYLVLPWCHARDESGSRAAPYYDERFLGYGWNKVEYIRHVRELGYLLWVVPRGFIIHAPHPPSTSMQAFFKGKDEAAMAILRKPMRTLWGKFQEELSLLVSSTGRTRLPTCKHHVKGKYNITRSDPFRFCQSTTA